MAVVNSRMHQKPINIGIINLMPQPRDYQADIEACFDAIDTPLVLHWIKLHKRIYSTTSDSSCLENYQHFEDFTPCNLDALIVTGAPVEHLDFEEVLYWSELQTVLAKAMQRKYSILGICWGAQAVAHQYGIKKQSLQNKCFGILKLDKSKNSETLSTLPQQFYCPFSSNAWFDTPSVDNAAQQGVIKVLARHSLHPYPIIASADETVVMHLGHPEYRVQRLLAEWHRDQQAGVATTQKPKGIAIEQPETYWKNHTDYFFRTWVKHISANATHDSKISNNAASNSTQNTKQNYLENAAIKNVLAVD